MMERPYEAMTLPSGMIPAGHGGEISGRIGKRSGVNLDLAFRCMYEQYFTELRAAAPANELERATRSMGLIDGVSRQTGFTC